MHKFCIHPAHRKIHLPIKSSISSSTFSIHIYHRVKCYHYMGVWAYNYSWIRSNWIHWKSRYIPIRNRGNSDGPEHCLWRTGVWASYCLWRTWTLSVTDLNILTEITCLLHWFQGLCMAPTTLYIQNNAYYIQIFTLCNCICIFQP